MLTSGSGGDGQASGDTVVTTGRGDGAQSGNLLLRTGPARSLASGKIVLETGVAETGAGGRGSHSSTFQLNLSRFCHKIHPESLLIPADTC